MISRGMCARDPGASHFFDNQYEFDLQEAVLKRKRQIAGR